MDRCFRSFKALMRSLAATLLVTAAAMGSPKSDDRLPARDSTESLVVTGVEDPELRAWFDRLSEPSSDVAVLTRISGVLEQSHRVSSPPGVRPRWIEEWFVRQSDGSTVALAIPVASDETEFEASRAGTRVACEGLEVGRLAVTGRDGIAREWPLFVARSVPGGGPVGGGGGVSGIVAATLIAGAGWLFLRRRAAVRSGRDARVKRVRSEVAADDRSVVSNSNLPQDPAEAMAVLADLTEEESSDGTSPSAGSQS